MAVSCERGSETEGSINDTECIGHLLEKISAL
jgi:hypothetical protein